MYGTLRKVFFSIENRRFWLCDKAPTPIDRGSFMLADKKVSTTVYITREQSEKLKLLHNETKVPVAEYIRQGIDWVLEQNADKMPGQLTLLK